MVCSLSRLCHCKRTWSIYFIINGVNDLAWNASIAVLFIITSCLIQSVINNYFIIVRYLIMYPSHMQCKYTCITICKLSSHQQTLKIQNNFYCSIHTIEYSRAFPEIIKTRGDRLLSITVISFHNSTRLLYHEYITNIECTSDLNVSAAVQIYSCVTKIISCLLTNFLYLKKISNHVKLFAKNSIVANSTPPPPLEGHIPP